MIRRDIGDLAATATTIETRRLLAVHIPATEETVGLCTNSKYTTTTPRPAPSAACGGEVLIAGDLNFGAPDDPTLHTSRSGVTDKYRDGKERARWRTVLQSTTEIVHHQPTRATFRHTASERSLTHNCIDRIFTTMAPTTTALRATMRLDAIRLAIPTDGFTPASDHVPVRATFTLRPPLPPAMRPIPTWVTRHPNAARVQARLGTLQLDRLEPADAVRRTRQGLRAEAAVVRNECLHKRPRTNGEVTQAALQAARAIHRHDEQALRRETARWPALAQRYDDWGSLRLRSTDTLHRLPGATIADPASLAPQRRPSADERRKTQRRPDADGAMTRAAAASVMLRPAAKRWFQLWVPHLRRQWLGQTQDPQPSTPTPTMPTRCLPTFDAQCVDTGRRSSAYPTSTTPPTNSSADTSGHSTTGPSRHRRRQCAQHSSARARHTQRPAPTAYPALPGEQGDETQRYYDERLPHRPTQPASPTPLLRRSRSGPPPREHCTPQRRDQRTATTSGAEHSTSGPHGYTAAKTIMTLINRPAAAKMDAWAPAQQGFVQNRGTLQNVLKLDTMATTQWDHRADAYADTTLGDAAGRNDDERRRRNDDDDRTEEQAAKRPRLGTSGGRPPAATHHESAASPAARALWQRTNDEATTGVTMRGATPAAEAPTATPSDLQAPRRNRAPTTPATTAATPTACPDPPTGRTTTHTHT